MRSVSFSVPQALLLSLACWPLVSACGEGVGTPAPTTGGAPGDGTGGVVATGGNSVGVGGSPSSGGSFASGGNGNGGLTPGSGGAESSGGSAVGGGDAAGGGNAGGSGAGGNAAGGSAAGGSAAGGGDGAGGTDAVGGGAGADSYNPDFVEFYGEDCPVGEPTDVSDPALPDLFLNFDGSRMAKKADWRCRRAEIKKVVEKYIHGPKPGTPDMVSGTVTATSITVDVTHDGKSTSFSVSISIPANATKPAPLILGLGGVGGLAPVIAAEGVASGSYNHSQLASETSRNGKFTDIYGTSTGASAQVAWAWGFSRIIDVLVAEKEAGRNDLIDPTAIGVTGCSRNGKGAFTIGAFDERIALGIPQESGTGGVSAFRVVNKNYVGPNNKPSQSLDSAWTEAQGWFGVPFGNYRSNVNVIPGDTHSLVAMYAPRGLVVLDNSRIGELGSKAQYAASAAGWEVFEALGVGKNIEYHGGNPSDPHNHCTFYESQEEPLRRAIKAHLTRTAPADGRVEPAAVATEDLTQWIKWEAPTLE